MAICSTIQNAYEQGEGILRLVPNWVPRSFCVPGCRIKLHPNDYFALGGKRGGIDERWFSSTTPAENFELYRKLGASKNPDRIKSQDFIFTFLSLKNISTKYL